MIWLKRNDLHLINSSKLWQIPWHSASNCKFRFYVWIPRFQHRRVITSHYDVFARLKHWLSDYMRQDTDCRVVLFLLTYLRMFSHVYFVLKLVLKWRRWLVHVCYMLPSLLNGGATTICHFTLNSAKTTFIVWILQYNGQNLKSDTLFYIKSTKAQCLLWFIG